MTSEDVSDVESENGFGSKVVSFFCGLFEYGVVKPLSYLNRSATFVLFILTVSSYSSLQSYVTQWKASREVSLSSSFIHRFEIF